MTTEATAQVGMLFVLAFIALCAAEMAWHNRRLRSLAERVADEADKIAKDGQPARELGSVRPQVIAPNRTHEVRASKSTHAPLETSLAAQPIGAWRMPSLGTVTIDAAGTPAVDVRFGESVCDQQVPPPPAPAVPEGVKNDPSV